MGLSVNIENKKALRRGDGHAREHGCGLLKIESWRVSSSQMSVQTSQGRFIVIFSFTTVIYSILIEFEFTVFKKFLGNMR